MGFSRYTRLRRQILAGWKFILSFRKSEWTLPDYPVDMVKQPTRPYGPAVPECRRIAPFRADIINWTVSGVGDTPQEAYRKLEEAFENARAQKDSIPRPGKHVPIDVKFADHGRIAAHEALAEEFTREVLEHEWAWISDESSLWDFTCEDSLDSFYAKILALYGVDVSGIASGNLAEILEAIARSGKVPGALRSPAPDL
jgi:hypothetical protein